MQCVENCNDPNPAHHVLYEQPVWQTLQMFLGEMLCFLPVIFAWLRTRRQSRPVQLPADSDEELTTGPKAHIPLSISMAGRSFSSGFPPPVISPAPRFVLSPSFLLPSNPLPRVPILLAAPWLSCPAYECRPPLHPGINLSDDQRRPCSLCRHPLRPLPPPQALALSVELPFFSFPIHYALFGVSLVGFSGSMIKDAVKEATISAFDELPPPQPIEEPEITKVLVALPSRILGVFFILFAQVLEDMGRYSVPPLLAVGYEGFFGTISVLLCMPLLAHYSSATPFFDLPRGWYQMIGTPTVLYSGIAIACSIALFNYFGLSVTRHVSATARSLTDTCRTLSIWLISLGLGWEALLWPISLLQVGGFALLVYGTFLFNNLVSPPRFLRPASDATPHVAHALLPEEEEEEETRSLFAEHALDETAALPADLGQSGFDVVPRTSTRASSPRMARSVCR
ncbi:Solute carrier family 35 member F6 [Grifola frondosa]|uniref:Solute carrier family 35 member F6 n=1 Tax=Grifola frondosa TaxID=5627 RepID=A0A1C7MG37_GRIFR|nr:Solute carrier family 35 member F6 [Grifola frondosa]